MNTTMPQVKQLIADYHMLDNAEIFFFIAMKADPHHIFYQGQDSESWTKINKHIQYIEI
jgi:hypothetical protein